VAADVSNRAGIVKLQQEVMATVWDASEVRSVERQNLYIVLAFLGEQDAGAAVISRIKEKLAQVRFEPIKVTYRGIGGSRSRTRRPAYG